MDYSEKDLVRIAKRENNKLRNYLVVNPLQAKHVPASPDVVLRLFTALAEKIRGSYAGEKLLLIGFAETATAIGAQVAITLGTKYIQTTREVIQGVEYLFFSEEHSHATEQKLVKDDVDAVLPEIDRIIFIEDEVTTGKTILNIVDILEKGYPRKEHGNPSDKLKFSVASLLNGMQREHLERYADRGIELFYLVKTDHSKYSDVAERYAGDGNYYDCSLHDIGNMGQLVVPGVVNARRLVDAAQYEAQCELFWEQIWNHLKRIERIENKENKRFLVVGTEEFMFPALYVGRKLEQAGNFVRCHSTTRSPIVVSREGDYPLHDRYELKSLYDSERRTFLYDIGAYDCVLIITDAPEQGREAGRKQELAAEPVMDHGTERGQEMRPEAAQSEAVQSEVARPEGARPEATQSEEARPEAAQSDDGVCSLVSALRRYNTNIQLVRWCEA